MRVGGNFQRDVAHVSLERLMKSTNKTTGENISAGGGKDEKVQKIWFLRITDVLDEHITRPKSCAPRYPLSGLKFFVG